MGAVRRIPHLWVSMICLKPYEMGYQAVKNLAFYLRGQQIETSIIPDTITVTAANVEEFAKNGMVIREEILESGTKQKRMDLNDMRIILMVISATGTYTFQKV